MQYLASFYVIKCALRYEKFYLVYISDFPTIGALSFLLFSWGGGGGGGGDLPRSRQRQRQFIQIHDNQQNFDHTSLSSGNLTFWWCIGGVGTCHSVFVHHESAEAVFRFFPRYPSNSPGGGGEGVTGVLFFINFEVLRKKQQVTEADSQGTVSHLIY